MRLVAIQLPPGVGGLAGPPKATTVTASATGTTTGLLTMDENALKIVKTGPREWTVRRGQDESRLWIFQKLSWARAFVAKNEGRKCPCGAPTHLGHTLPCFEDSDECLPCQQAALERMAATVYDSKW